MSANGSRIITREREEEERLIRQAKRIDAMHPTIGEVKEIVQELFGPLASLLREVCVRQQLLEDFVGATFVPATGDQPDHFVLAPIQTMTGTVADLVRSFVEHPTVETTVSGDVE